MEFKGRELIRKGYGEKNVLLLHGRGSDATDIISFAGSLGVKNCNFYAITAKGNAWYPNKFDIKKELNEPYLTESLELIDSFVREKDVKVIIGFSQGACLALDYLKINKEVDVIALSGGFIGDDTEIEFSEKMDNNVFIGCSRQDPFIPIERAEKSFEILKKNGCKIERYFYDVPGHSVSEYEFNFVKRFLDG